MSLVAPTVFPVRLWGVGDGRVTSGQVVGQMPQSIEQLMQSSPSSQSPLPQVGGQMPQSVAQVVQSSPAARSQNRSPQTAPPQVRPHSDVTSPTHRLSQNVAQQNGSVPQISIVHASQPVMRADPSSHRPSRPAP